MEADMRRKNGERRDIGVMLKEAGILFAITLTAGLLLGFVYELTKEPIAEQERKAVREACAAVFQEAASFETVEYVPSEELLEELSGMGVIPGSAFQALGSDGSALGHVVESVSRRGYGGRLVLYVGIASDGTLKGVSILDISETPGLGMRAKEVLCPQFKDKKADSFVYTKTGATADNEIDAIAGATVTTKAFTSAVNGALQMARELEALQAAREPGAQGGGGDE